MKLIFLNTWNGKVRDGALQFLIDQSSSTDIFCLQEAQGEMRGIAQGPLCDFEEVTAYKYLADDHTFAQATYAKKNTKILHSEPIFEDDRCVGLGLYVQVPLGKDSAHICNFHGISRPGNKLDSPARLRQFKGLCDFFEHRYGPKIIGGDFNVLPATRSIEMFQEKGYRNLINEFRITTTRNRLAWESYPNNRQDFADYVFVSPEVKVLDFSVPSQEISDHLPLILKIQP